VRRMRSGACGAAGGRAAVGGRRRGIEWWSGAGRTLGGHSPYQGDVLVRGSEALAKTKDGARDPRSDLAMWEWGSIRDWLSGQITP